MSQYLILGGARSGKSSFAERLIEKISTEKGTKKVYVATATAGDDEMSDRIQRHKNHVLIDCLTLWLSNCLHKGCWTEQRAELLSALQTCQADVVMVSNEVGSGIIPMGELSRQFTDQSGWLHQDLAQQCSHVSLIVAGLESTLKTPNLNDSIKS